MRTLTREQAIDELRTALLALVDDDHSLCEVAAQHGLPCRGFRQFTDEELRERYDWIVKRRGIRARSELEELANRWQLARQFVQNVSLSCDVQTREHDTCRGWDGITDEMLVAYLLQLHGEKTRIAPSQPRR